MASFPASLARATDAPGVCARCGAEMEERKCKIVCQSCGSFADCSAP